MNRWRTFVERMDTRVRASRYGLRAVPSPVIRGKLLTGSDPLYIDRMEGMG